MILVNKALYNIDGVKVKLKDEGIDSSILLAEKGSLR